MSFYGSALLYAECVSADISVRSICLELRPGDIDQDPIDTAFNPDLRTTTFVPSNSYSIKLT